MKHLATNHDPGDEDTRTDAERARLSFLDFFETALGVLKMSRPPLVNTDLILRLASGCSEARVIKAIKTGLNSGLSFGTADRLAREYVRVAGHKANQVIVDDLEWKDLK